MFEKVSYYGSLFNIKSSLIIRETINNALRWYKEMYEEKWPKKKKVQISVLQFVKNKNVICIQFWMKIIYWYILVTT